MNTGSIDFWLSIPCLIIGILSCFGNAYVFVAAKAFQDYLIPHSNDYVILKLIHWLAFIDFWWCILVSANYLPTAFNLGPFPNGICTIIGMGIEFSGIFAALWHMLIASCFASLLFLSSNIVNDNITFLQNKKLYNRIVFTFTIVSLFFTIIPSFIDGKNNYSYFHNYYDLKNNIGYGYECWLIGDWRLTFYIPALISLLFHYTVLIFAIKKYKQTKYFTKAYLYLIERLIPWIIVYSIVRIIPMTVRMWDVVGNAKLIPLWLVVSHHICISGVGVANALVWYFSRRVDPIRREESKQSNLISNSLRENLNNGNYYLDPVNGKIIDPNNNQNNSVIYDDVFTTVIELNQTV